MQSLENILFHELIGLKIKICQSPQSSLVNLTGLIVFETKNLLVIKTLKGIKKIAKNIILKCIIYLHSIPCFIKGNQLIGRPEDRILKIKR
ncbi:MAG TPA: ribonuclease P protein subunit [Nitrososphaeraceae archaeon]|nr:ribonuclease P protein subunit [Nitrososphaeraceae archaeon]